MAAEGVRFPVRSRLVWLALAGFLSWWLACWLATGWYFTAMAERAVLDEGERAERFIANSLRGFGRQLAVRQGAIAMLARTREVRLGVAARDPGMGGFLDGAARALSFDRMFLLDGAGNCVAESNSGAEKGLIGLNFAERGYFQSARAGMVQGEVSVGKVSQARGVRMAAPVLRRDGRFIGALAARVDLSQFADRIGQADALLSDRNGVVVLARDKTLEMRALPGAAVARLDGAARRALYQRDAFPAIAVDAWGDARYPGLRRVAGRRMPVLVRSAVIQGGLLTYTLFWPVAQVVELGDQRVAAAAMAGMVGSFMMLSILGGLGHLRGMRATNHALAAREREFRALVENLPSLIMRYGRDCRCRYVNPAFEALTGLGPAEVVGTAPDAFWRPGINMAAAEFQARLGAVMTTGEAARFALSWPLGDGGGTSRHDLYVVAERDGDGAIVGALVIGDNVTERRRAEQALAESRHFLDRVIEEIPDPVFVKDGELRWVLVNEAFCRLLGQPRDALLGKPDGAFFSERQARLSRDKDELVLASGLDSVNEEKLTNADGVERIIVTKRARHLDAAGRAFIVGIVSDITGRKQVEALLRAREREFRLLAENLPDVIVRYDRGCRRTYVSPVHERITGLPAHVVLGKSPVEHWSVPTGPVGAATFQGHLLRVLETGQPSEWELAWSRADGSRVCMELRAMPEFDRDGRPSGVLTVARDVSAQRTMEQYLRMAASVFETAREGIIITDPDGLILDVNPAFTAISGYARDEALGRRPSMLSSGRQDQPFYAALWATLKADGVWSGEVVNRRKGGEIYTEHLDIATVRDEAGAVKHYVGIFSDISQIKLHEQRLQHLAHHDALTGLPNRLLLTDRMLHAIAQARRAGDGTMAVLYMDLDGFKPINDMHGHEMGDRVLTEIARRIAETVRSSDTVARIGGDEFVALLVDQSGAKECEFAARRLLDAIARPVMLDGQMLNLSASIGISLFPDDDDDPDILLRYADQAMYSAKGSGRNQFVFHGSDAREKSKMDGQMIHDLRHAIDQDQITVYYQPIVDMATGRVVKAEALARWSHPLRGAVPPSEFIPIAEDAGLIHAIGDRVFRHAARVAREWNRLVGPRPEGPPRISVNRSPRQFFNRDGVAGWVSHLIEQGIPGQYLAVEITEGLLLDDRPDVLKQLNQLRAMGVTVSLDDFGTGYSALAYLKKFDIDYLKIDRSFVRDIVDDPNDRAIVESITVMARLMGITLIAEGVETPAQAELLSRIGCDLAQGYLYARPMPEAEFLAFVMWGGFVRDINESIGST